MGDSGEPRGPSGRRAGLRYGLAAAIGAVLAGAVLLVSAQDRVDHAAEVNLSAPGPLDSYLRGMMWCDVHVSVVAAAYVTMGSNVRTYVL